MGTVWSSHFSVLGMHRNTSTLKRELQAEFLRHTRHVARQNLFPARRGGIPAWREVMLLA
jgi:hypothetical protein